MAINSSKVDEEQKEVLKSATIRRLFSYLKNYKRQVAASKSCSPFIFFLLPLQPAHRNNANKTKTSSFLMFVCLRK